MTQNIESQPLFSKQIKIQQNKISNLQLTEIQQYIVNSQQKIYNNLQNEFKQTYKIDEIDYDQLYGDDKNSFAMWIAKQKIIPPQQFQHLATLQNKNGQTVQKILEENGLQVPQWWKCYKFCWNFNFKSQNESNFKTFNFLNNTQQLHEECNQNQFLRTFFKQQSNNNYAWNNEAMKLAEKGIIPELDNYKPLARNKYGETVAILLAQKEIIPPKCWMHDINIQDKYGLSIKTILQNRQLPVPQHWQNEEEMTIFDQACFRIIPDITGHKSDEQNEDGFTVAMILTINNINIPVEWQHDPNIQNKYKCTVAMYQARNGHIPDKIWYHNKYLRCKYQVENNPNSFMDRVQFYTVQNILQSKNIQVPQEWKYTSLNEEENNQAIINATNGIIPELDNYNPDYQNIYGDTVAMLLAEKEIIPPKVWMHNMNIINRFDKSLKQVLQYYKLPVPQHWQDNDILNIFDQACFKIIPKLDNHKPEEQNEDGFTVAMILLLNNIEVPKEWQHDINIKNKYYQTLFDICLVHKIKPQQWFCKQANWQDQDGNTQAMLLADQDIDIPKYLYHDSQIQNNDGITVAMLQADCGKIPDEQWIHDKYLRSRFNICYYTVQNILQKQNIQVPEEWKYDPLNGYEDNQAIIDAKNGIIPKLEDNYPEYQNIYGDTVAMILARQGIIPPRCWMHDSEIKNIDGLSIKLLLQDQCLPVPRHWKDNDMTIFDQACFGIIPKLNSHKPNEQDQDGFTVAMILTINKIDVPKEWQHDITIKNKYNQTLVTLQEKFKQIKYSIIDQIVLNRNKLNWQDKGDQKFNNSIL